MEIAKKPNREEFPWETRYFNWILSDIGEGDEKKAKTGPVIPWPQNAGRLIVPEFRQKKGMIYINLHGVRFPWAD